MSKFRLPSRPALIVAVMATLLGLAIARPDAVHADDGAQCMNTCSAHTTLDARACAQSCNVMLLDQRCLSLCLGQGNNGNQCRSSCGYIRPDLLSPTAKLRSNPHSQFTQMTPADPTQIIVSPAAPAAPSTSAANLAPKTQPLAPSTNYKCVAACTQKGMTQGYCMQTCSY